MAMSCDAERRRRERERADDPDRVRPVADARQHEAERGSATCVTAIHPRRRPQNGGA